MLLIPTFYAVVCIIVAVLLGNYAVRSLQNAWHTDFTLYHALHPRMLAG